MVYRFLLPGLAGIILFPDMAFAYVGPGAGLSAIGSLLVLVGAIVLAIIGFVWYPVRRLVLRRRTGAIQPQKEDPPH